MKQNAQGGVLLGQETMSNIVPVFVAGMVLLIRVLLINTFSIAGDRIFSLAEDRQSSYQNKPVYRPSSTPVNASNNVYSPRPAPKPTPVASARPLYNEPSYHPIGMSAQAQNENTNSYTRR